MTDDHLNFIIAARDNASATVARVNREVSALGPAAGRAAGPLGALSKATGGLISPATLAIGAFAALSAAAIAFGADAVHAAMEDEKSVALLTTAVRENDAAMADHGAQIEAVIKSRVRLGFADDEQRASLGALVAVTKDANKALEIQRVAMDLARLKGMDLEAATTLLGKVYGGNIGILARYGIQLERGATSTEAMEEIQRRAAGQAEAYGDTTAGAAEVAGIALGELQESIGQKLLPVLKELSQWLLDEGIPAVEQFGSEIGGLFDDIADLVKPIADFLNALDDFRRSVNGLPPVWRGAMGEIEKDASGLGGRVGADLATGAAATEAGAEEGLADPVAKVTAAMKQDAEDAARALTGAYADELASGADVVEQGWEALLSGAADQQTKAQRIAAVNAKLTSEELRNALASEDPYLRQQAIAYRETLEAELAKLSENAIYQAYLTGQSIPDVLAEKAQAAATAAVNYANGVAVNLNIGARARAAGEGAASAFVAGFAANEWRMLQQVGISMQKVEALLQLAGSPPFTKARSAARGVMESYADEINRTAARTMRGLAGPIGRMLPSGVPGGRRGGGDAGGLTVIFQSTYPPTPGQADALARQMGPAIERWRRRNA